MEELYEQQRKNRLLVLDLNGVLMMKKYKKGKLPYIKIYKGTFEFIEKCLNYSDIAFFSSTTRKNAEPIIKKILEPFEKYTERIKFQWFREHTDPDPTSKNEWDTVKYYSKIKEKYPNHQIIIVDDSPDKLRFNPVENTLITQSGGTELHYDLLMLEIVMRFFDLD